MRTTRLTPAAFAASTRCTTPSLSTACAAWAILNGLPGTNPVQITTTSVPFMGPARTSAGAVTSKPGRSSTPPLSMPSFEAFSGERTAAVMPAPPRLRSSSTTSWPVCPVAPTTRILGGTETGAAGGAATTSSSASASDAIEALDANVMAARAPEMASRRPARETPPSTASGVDDDSARTTCRVDEERVDGRTRPEPEPRTAARAERRSGRLPMETRREVREVREVDIAGSIAQVRDGLVLLLYPDRIHVAGASRRLLFSISGAGLDTPQGSNLSGARTSNDGHVNPRPGRGGAQRQPAAPGSHPAIPRPPSTAPP